MTVKKHRLIMGAFLSLLALLGTSRFTYAQDAAAAEPTSPQEVAKPADSQKNVLTGPSRVDCDYGHYPLTESLRRREGWVNLRLMVKADGSVGDAEVVSSYGSDAFVDVALKRASTCKFKPAIKNGAPVEYYGVNFPMTFRMEGLENAVFRTVGRQFQQVGTLITEGQYDEAWALLDRIEKDCTTIYEIAHLMLRRAVLMAHRGDLHVALAYLQEMRPIKSSLNEDDRALVDRLTLRMLLQTKRILEARTLGRSMKDWGQRAGDDELKADFEKISKAAYDDPVWVVEGEIPQDCPVSLCGKTPSWSYRPSHLKVSLDQVEGHLDSVKLNCWGRKEVRFEAVPNVTWTIPMAWAICTLTVTGTPGSKFTLIDEIPESQ